jgi:hypothetical protein
MRRPFTTLARKGRISDRAVGAPNATSSTASMPFTGPLIGR